MAGVPIDHLNLAGLRESEDGELVEGSFDREVDSSAARAPATAFGHNVDRVDWQSLLLCARLDSLICMSCVCAKDGGAAVLLHTQAVVGHFDACLSGRAEGITRFLQAASCKAKSRSLFYGAIQLKDRAFSKSGASKCWWQA